MPNQYTYKTKQDRINAFWDKVDKSGGDDACWEWQFGKDSKGYGQFKWEGKMRKAHRLMYKFTHGETPDNLLVCHHCDNPSCVNPSHLFLGTHQDNVDDMIRKGRDRRGDNTGEKHGLSKLTWVAVREIRRLYSNGNITQAELAKRFNVTQPNIGCVVRCDTWKE